MELIPILGATSSGKSSIAIDVALATGAEIISCDSRQLYREMCIGTAVPDAEMLLKIKHHFIQSHSIFTPLTTGDYEREALQLLKKNRHRDHMILVGGTGLYAQALLFGLDDIPDIKLGIRDVLEKTLASEGLVKLQELLKIEDPEMFLRIDFQNPRRIIRALEIKRSTGRSQSSFFTKKKLRFAQRIFIIDHPQEILQSRIDQRVDEMMSRGLLSEVRTLYGDRNRYTLIPDTLGYSDFFPYLEGRSSLESCVACLKKNTLKYAKRQRTWFKKMQNTVYIGAPNESQKILSYYNL